MPIYKHVCDKCGKEHEVWTTIAKRDEYTLCECGGHTYLEVATNQTGFALKGDNWAKGEARRRWGDDTSY